MSLDFAASSKSVLSSTNTFPGEAAFPVSLKRCLREEQIWGIEERRREGGMEEKKADNRQQYFCSSDALDCLIAA